MIISNGAAIHLSFEIIRPFPFYLNAKCSNHNFNLNAVKMGFAFLKISHVQEIACIVVFSTNLAAPRPNSGHVSGDVHALKLRV